MTQDPQVWVVLWVPQDLSGEMVRRGLLELMVSQAQEVRQGRQVLLVAMVGLVQQARLATTAGQALPAIMEGPAPQALPAALAEQARMVQQVLQETLGELAHKVLRATMVGQERQARLVLQEQPA